MQKNSKYIDYIVIKQDWRNSAYYIKLFHENGKIMSIGKSTYKIDLIKKILYIKPFIGILGYEYNIKYFKMLENKNDKEIIFTNLNKIGKQ